jgi:hypothetical protein
MVLTHDSIISELCKLLENDFSTQLGSDGESFGSSDRQFLRIEGVLCNSIEDGPHAPPEDSPNRRLVLVRPQSLRFVAKLDAEVLV